jgi:hypothetical protein
MSDLDSQLHRLYRAAARADQPDESSLPHGFVTRVLAEYRTARAEGPGLFLSAWCRRATVCACSVAAFCVLLNFSSTQRRWQEWRSPEARLLSSAYQFQLP